MSSNSDEPDLDPEDFWDDDSTLIPSNQISPSKASVDFRRQVTLVQSSLRFMLKTISTEAEDIYKQRMEGSIKKLRKENNEQVRNVKQVVRNTTRRELKSAVDEIKAQFEKEVYLIKQDHDKMKEEIAKKNKEVLLIAEYMIDQETVIAQHRISCSFKYEEVDKSAEILSEEKQLKKDLNVVKVQIDAMKEAIKEYSNDTIQSASKVKELDQEIARIQLEHRQELKQLEAFLESQVEKAISDRDSIKEQFENYKKLGWKELEEKEDSCAKQREVINLLQNELKRAKGILHNPRLKLRVHERLKDYLDEYENESNESPALLTNKTAALKSKRSRLIDSRNIHSRNYDRSGRLASTQEQSLDLPKFTTKKNNLLEVHRSRISEFNL